MDSISDKRLLRYLASFLDTKSVIAFGRCERRTNLVANAMQPLSAGCNPQKDRGGEEGILRGGGQPLATTAPRQALHGSKKKYINRESRDRESRSVGTVYDVVARTETHLRIKEISGTTSHEVQRVWTYNVQYATG